MFPVTENRTASLKRTESLEHINFDRGRCAATAERCCPAVLPVRTPSSQILGTCFFFWTKETLRLSEQMSSRRKPVNAATLLIILMEVFSGLSLTCHPSEYEIGNQCCPKCLPGKQVQMHCNENGKISCLPCVDGTYTDKPNGREQCTPCANCDSALGLRVKKRCTATSDTVCEPLEGFYCVHRTGHSCERAQEHKRCKPGQYISQNGTASTDTECSDCSSGTFSDGTFHSCQPHIQCHSLNLQQITAGTSAADAQCGERSFNVGAVVGGAVAVLIVIIGGGLLLLWYLKKRAPSNRSPTKEEGTDVECSPIASSEGEGDKRAMKTMIEEAISNPSTSSCAASCGEQSDPATS